MAEPGTATSRDVLLETTQGPPTGTRLLTEWLAQNAAIVGKRYASEVLRHYRSPARSSDHSG